MTRKNKILAILFLIIGALVVSRPIRAEAPDITGVKICNRAVNSGDKAVLRYQDLKKGKIKITGDVSDALNISGIEVSIDAGENWERLEAVKAWEYEFIPQTAKEYTFLAHSVDKSGNLSGNFIAIIQPDAQELVSMFERIFKDMRDIYIEERLRDFLKFFAQDSYPNFIAFSENMENTFDQSGNFNLKINIRNVALEEDMALVRVDWIKTYEDASRDSGANNVIRFSKTDGTWKIIDIEDEKIFIVGSGVFKGNVTDR